MQGVPGRFEQRVLDLADAKRDASPFRTKCHFIGPTEHAYDATCVLGGTLPPKVIVYGDSHGIEMSAALGALAKSREESVRQITATACPPAVGFPLVTSPLDTGKWCVPHNEAMLAKLVSIAPATIIIAANSLAWSDYEPERYWRGIRTTLVTLSGVGHRLIVLGPMPRLPNHMPAPATVARWTSLGNDPADFKFSPDRKFGDVDAKLKSIASEVDATYVPVAPLFCKDDRCNAYLEEGVLYYDDNHVSMLGAVIIAKKLLVPLLWPDNRLAGAQSQR